LAPLAEHRFSYEGSARELVFTVGGDGKASSVTQALDGGTRVARRTEKPPQPPPKDPALLADAVLAGDLERVRKLVAEGADVHGLDTRPQVAGANGRRPLNWAALNNNTKMIELLLELGADINRQNLSGFTPLHHAVEAEAVEAIELLLSRGADTTIKNGRNLTPAEFARASRRSRAAEALGVGVLVE
jgi:ankyrin repeat protein